jgi:hypothetical protein
MASRRARSAAVLEVVTVVEKHGGINTTPTVRKESKIELEENIQEKNDNAVTSSY